MVTRTLISKLVQDISHLYPAKNVKDLIRSLGGTLCIASNDNLESGIMRRNDSFQICVSPHLDQKNTDYLIAYELGHLFLHMGYKTCPDLWRNQKNNSFYIEDNVEKTYEAAQFAFTMLALFAE